jgi:hypothetical protein
MDAPELIAEKLSCWRVWSFGVVILVCRIGFPSSGSLPMIWEQKQRKWHI